MTVMCSNLQMERQMSMGSNIMGMQGPTHSSSCSSTHIPSMHSEAKLVSSIYACIRIYIYVRANTHTRVHSLRLKELQALFHWAVPAKLCL